VTMKDGWADSFAPPPVTTKLNGAKKKK